MHFNKEWNTYPWLRKILESLEDGSYSINKWHPTRSILQNDRYFGMLTYVSIETGNSKDSLHELMKKKFLTKRKLVKLGKKKIWSQITQSTTKLTTKKFMQYNDEVEQFFREFDIFIPPVGSLEFQNLIS